MKPQLTPFVVKMVIGASFVLLGLCASVNIHAASTIEGTVYDKQRNSLSDIEVELLNDFYQSVRRTRTDGSGRYQFVGLNDGRYSVKVYAFRYDLEDQTMPVEIVTVNIRGGQGTGYFTQDFYLVPRKGGLRDAELSVIFAQDIPKEAKVSYEKAIEDFSKKRTQEGFESLKKSLELFPDYYLALHRFGMELFMIKQYMESAQVFLKAVDVNPKSATSFYYLAYSFHNLGKDYNKAALRSLDQAHILAPASPQVLLLFGRVERAANKFAEAEKHLLKAKKVATTKVPEIHKELAQLYANDLKKFDLAASELELYLQASKASGEEEKKMKEQIAILRAKAKTQIGN